MGWLTESDFQSTDAVNQDNRLESGVHVFDLEKHEDKRVETGTAVRHRLFFTGTLRETTSALAVEQPVYISLPLDGFGARKTKGIVKHMLCSLIRQRVPGSDPETQWTAELQQAAAGFLIGSRWRVRALEKKARDTGYSYYVYGFDLLEPDTVLGLVAGTDDDDGMQAIDL